jgi:hypothetical protein
MKQLIIIIIALLVFRQLPAQINADNTAWMQYLDELAESDESVGDMEHIFEELSYLSEHPFDLQTVTKTDLERLPFLSAVQIENILYYIYKFGPLADIYELKNVEALDFQTITFLLPFVFVGKAENSLQNSPYKKQFRYPKQELMLRSDYTFQKKAGYTGTEEERAAKPNKYYLGEPYYASFRYGVQYKDFIRIGISGEKDAGEAFWNKNHKGFDYYAFNLNITNQGVLENLHIGDYRLSFGQGLVMNTNFSMGKTAMIDNINLNNNGIKRHISTNENDFFQGLAGTLKFHNLQISLFYSNRKHDANADSSTVYTFKTDGYNRVPKDLEKRRSASINMEGTHIQWRNETLNIGLTSVYYSFGGKEWNPDPRPYNLFYLRAKNHFNSGIDYGYGLKNFSFHGETAVDANGKMATVHNLLFKPASSIDWICSYRNYARDYNAFYAKGFSESSSIQNEKGLYSGIRFHLSSKWELSAYTDNFQSPWLKYRIDAPSSGIDELVQVFYRRNTNLSMNLRYRYKKKDQNTTLENGKETLVLPYKQHRWRYQFNYQNEKGYGLKVQADYNLYNNISETQSGWSLTGISSFFPHKSKFQIDGALAYFHSGNWDNRINIYEKNILYAYSFQSYYGEGFRFYSLVKWKIARSLTIYLKLASTRYFDRELIGSDLEAIDGRDKTDILGLLKFSF